MPQNNDGLTGLMLLRAVICYLLRKKQDSKVVALVRRALGCGPGLVSAKEK